MKLKYCERVYVWGGGVGRGEEGEGAGERESGRVLCISTLGFANLSTLGGGRLRLSNGVVVQVMASLEDEHCRDPSMLTLKQPAT